MDALALLADGISRATSPELLIATLIGVVVGLIVGVLPGIGPAAGTAIMLPVAVGFGGAAAIAGLAGIYYGAMFGGAVTSILLGIPGDAPSVMTVIDGHALAKRGEAGRALGMSVYASFIGGVIGIVLLALLSVPVAQAATFVTSTARRLFKVKPFGGRLGADFEVSPDGRRFLFLMPGPPITPRQSQLIFVQGWVEELRARLAKQ